MKRDHIDACTSRGPHFWSYAVAECDADNSDHRHHGQARRMCPRAARYDQGDVGRRVASRPEFKRKVDERRLSWTSGQTAYGVLLTKAQVFKKRDPTATFAARPKPLPQPTETWVRAPRGTTVFNKHAPCLAGDCRGAGAFRSDRQPSPAGTSCVWARGLTCAVKDQRTQIPWLCVLARETTGGLSTISDAAAEVGIGCGEWVEPVMQQMRDRSGGWKPEWKALLAAVECAQTRRHSLRSSARRRHAGIGAPECGSRWVADD